VGYYVYLWHGTSVCWHIKTQLESGPVTTDLTTTVVHSYTLLTNDIKPVYSLTYKANNKWTLFILKVVQTEVENNLFFNESKRMLILKPSLYVTLVRVCDCMKL